jgi:hypothetical protein
MPDRNRELALESALLRSYEQWRDLGYRAARLYQVFMPHCKRYQGGVAAVRGVISKSGTAGLDFLKAHERTDLSIESLVLRPEWSDLFSEQDRKMARLHLKISR